MPDPTPLTVMTRNLYLGADIDRPLLAASSARARGDSPEEALLALAEATHLTRAIVDRTDFTVRARLVAEEVARTRPDLVGLQEVALWRSGPLGLDRAGVPDATEVDLDFLEVLLAALEARGLAYAVAAIGTRADVEAPCFTGSPYDGSLGGDPRDVRLTMRDVVLVRDTDGLEVTATGDHVFTRNLTVPIRGTTLGLDRGCQWVDVRAGSASLRFVNTHLEALGVEITLAQAEELLALAAAPDRSTILVGDLNTAPGSPPYELITAAGFVDGWLAWPGADAGLTCGLSELLDDPEPRFDHRIDHVLVRTASGAVPTVVHAEVTGTAPADRDATTGLWASDHGGVVLRLTGL